MDLLITLMVSFLFSLSSLVLCVVLPSLSRYVGLMLFPVTGAKQPNYLVTADDVETYLAIEVQPLDNRKRKVLFLFFPFYFYPPPTQKRYLCWDGVGIDYGILSYL